MIHLIRETYFIPKKPPSLPPPVIYGLTLVEFSFICAITYKYKDSINLRFKNKNIYQISGLIHLTSIAILFVINKTYQFANNYLCYRKQRSILQTNLENLSEKNAGILRENKELRDKLANTANELISTKYKLSSEKKRYLNFERDISKVKTDLLIKLKTEMESNRKLVLRKEEEKEFVKRELATIKQASIARECKVKELERSLNRANERLRELQSAATTIADLKQELAKITHTKQALQASLASAEAALQQMKEESYAFAIKSKMHIVQRLRYLALGFEEEEDLPKEPGNKPPWSDEHLAFWLGSYQLQNLSDLQWKEDNVPSRALATLPANREFAKEDLEEMDKIVVEDEFHLYFDRLKDRFPQNDILGMKWWLIHSYPNSNSYSYISSSEQAPSRMKTSLQKLFYLIKKHQADDDRIHQILYNFTDAVLRKCPPTWFKVSEEEADKLIAPLDLKDLLLRCVHKIKIDLIQENPAELDLNELSRNANEWHVEGYVIKIAGKELGIRKSLIHKYDHVSNRDLTPYERYTFALNVFKFAAKKFTSEAFAQALPINIEMLDTDDTREQVDTYLYKYLFPEGDFSTFKWSIAQDLFFDKNAEGKRTLNRLAARALLEHIGYI